VGAVATLLDLTVLLMLVKGLRLPNPLAAMAGVAVGATFSFFANRQLAFTDRSAELAPQALKFAWATALGMGAHGVVVYQLADRLGMPVVLAKLAADVVVFSVGQLLVLRYLVFPSVLEPQAPPEP
jgi:putative flippase GtrA